MKLPKIFAGIVAFFLGITDAIEKRVHLMLSMRSLRKDQDGFSALEVVGALIAVLIAVIIGFALFSTLLSQVATVNSTSMYGANSPIPGLANLVPLFWILGIALAAVAIVFVAIKAGIGAA